MHYFLTWFSSLKVTVLSLIKLSFCSTWNISITTSFVISDSSTPTCPKYHLVYTGQLPATLCQLCYPSCSFPTSLICFFFNHLLPGFPAWCWPLPAPWIHLLLILACFYLLSLIKVNNSVQFRPAKSELWPSGDISDPHLILVPTNGLLKWKAWEIICTVYHNYMPLMSFTQLWRTKLSISMTASTAWLQVTCS